MKKPRGFTLIEALMTLLIVFLVLGIGCELLNEYSTVLTFSATKDSELTGIQVAQQQLLDELRESTLVSSPTVGTSTADVQFQRIDPAPAWPPPFPNPLPNGYVWPLYDPSTMIDVHYYLANGTVVREAGPSGSLPSSSWTVAEGVSGLQITALADGLYQVKLSLLQGERLEVVTGTSMRPVI